MSEWGWRRDRGRLLRWRTAWYGMMISVRYEGASPCSALYVSNSQLKDDLFFKRNPMHFLKGLWDALRSWSASGHSKIHPDQTWPGKGSIVANSIRVNDDQEISQPDAEYDPELGQSDPIICQVCGKLTDFRVILDPEWSLAPMDPFRVKFDPGVYRVECEYISWSHITGGTREVMCKSHLRPSHRNCVKENPRSYSAPPFKEFPFLGEI